MAGCERQPKAFRLKRARKIHLWEGGFDFMIILFLFGSLGTSHVSLLQKPLLSLMIEDNAPQNQLALGIALNRCFLPLTQPILVSKYGF
jgi:hypothetical protein